MMIIGISGKKQSGKNSVGWIINFLDIYYNKLDWEALCKREDIPQEKWIYNVWKSPYRFEYNFELKSFASNVKEIASLLIGRENIESWEKSEFKDSINPIFNITNREILQKIGEGLRKEINPDVWIKALFSTYTEKSNWIITDVRYKNEADYIKEKGGYLIRVNRDTGYNDNHPSEIDLDNYSKFDFIIDNNDSEMELVKKVTEIYNKLF